MECMQAQQHMWDYYTDLARRAASSSGATRGRTSVWPHNTMAEAYMRVYPQVTRTCDEERGRHRLPARRSGRGRRALAELRRGDRARGDRPERLPRTAAIRPVYPGSRVGGTAVTVLCWPGDNLMIHAAVEQCRPGDILVVTTTSPLPTARSASCWAPRCAASRRARSGHHRRRARLSASCAPCGSLCSARPYRRRARLRPPPARSTCRSASAASAISPGDAISRRR